MGDGAILPRQRGRPDWRCPMLPVLSAPVFPVDFTFFSARFSLIDFADFFDMD